MLKRTSVYLKKPRSVKFDILPVDEVYPKKSDTEKR